jgi:hypothetical protein
LASHDGARRRFPGNHAIAIQTDGSFRCEHVPAGAWTIQLWHGTPFRQAVDLGVVHLEPDAFKHVELSVIDLEITELEGAVSVDGLVPAAARVQLVPLSGSASPQVFTFTFQAEGARTRSWDGVNMTTVRDGRYRLGVRSGTYRAWVLLPLGDRGNECWYEARPQPIVVGGPRQGIDLQVATNTFRLVLVGPEGPIARGRGMVLCGDAEFGFTTDARGEARLACLPSGICRVSVERESGLLVSRSLRLPGDITNGVLEVKLPDGH